VSWWERKKNAQEQAVAYYRHSAQDRQENSVEIQREQVHAFADENSIEIIKEFADRGISGLSTEGRDGFNEMLDDYVVGNKADFQYVLVLDVSRWGRFQDTDLSSYYSGLCAKNGKRVIYTSIGFPKDDGLLHGLHMSIERYRAASYSKELSGKVWKGCAKIASGGYWAGGMPPYGMSRLLLDEQRNPLRVLRSGEHKAIHNQRVTLVPGDKDQVETIQRIFSAVADDDKRQDEIARMLNDERIQAPGGGYWNRSSVTAILRNEIYAGTMIWNKTSQKMKSPTHRNPPDEWVRRDDAFEAVVPRHLFQLVQEILDAREEEFARRYLDEEMLRQFALIHDRYGVVNGKLLAASENTVSPATYVKHFGSMEQAYQAMFKDVIERRTTEVREILQSREFDVMQIDDLLIVENSFSIRIQPSVPVISGFEVYWVFHPHERREIDLTIGVPLSEPDSFTVLGYLALPRLLFTLPRIENLYLADWDHSVFSFGHRHYLCREHWHLLSP